MPTLSAYRNLSIAASCAILAAAGLPSAPARADSVATPNSCINSFSGAVSRTVTLSGTASPNPVAVGTPLNSYGLSLSGSTDPILDAYKGGAFGPGGPGAKTIPYSGSISLAASNTSEGTQTITAAIGATFDVTITDPTPLSPASGDESISPAIVTLFTDDLPWTPSAAGIIEFSQDGAVSSLTSSTTFPLIVITETCTADAPVPTFEPVTVEPTLLGDGIFYSGANQNIVWDDFSFPGPISLAGDGGTWDDFNVNCHIFEDPGFQNDYVCNHNNQAGGSFVEAAEIPGQLVKRFSAAETIGPGETWTGIFNGRAYSRYFEEFSPFPFVDEQGEFRNESGFAGIRMTNGPDVFYGWVLVTVRDYDNANLALTLNEWAFYMTPDVSIDAGQSVPEPDVLLLLGSGVAGLVVMSRRRIKRS